MRLTRAEFVGSWPAALLASAAGGAAAAAAYPPLDWGPLAFVALVPLALVFRHGGPKRVAGASAAFGLTFLALLFPWIHLFGLAAYLLLVGLEAAFITAFLSVATLLRDRLPGRARWVAFPLALLAGEYVRSNWPLGGFPWGGLGYSQHNNRIALRVAAYAGVWGVSLLVATVNALVAEALVRVRVSPRKAALRLAIALGLLLAPVLLPVTTPRGAAATLALVQGNAPLQDPRYPHALDQEALANQVNLTATLAGRKVSLVVWPESSLGHDPFSDPTLLDPLLATIRQAGVPFVVGATIPTTAGGHSSHFRNVSLFFNADGSLSGRYVKMHLVPFGEYVPGRHLLAGWIKELNRVPSDGISGTSPTIFSLPEGRFGSVICYETAYPNLVGAFVRKGARMIVVSTDNSSYRRSATSAQMVAMSQLRAAEQRMWVTQAALTGISAVIAPDGRVVQRTGLFQSALLTPDVRFATSTTPFGRFGDWLPIAVLILGTAFLAATALASPRPQAQP